MPVPAARLAPVDRAAFAGWYRRNRARSRALFDMLDEAAYYSQPIALRHPIVFYEGHLPAFSFNTLAKRALGRSSLDERLERLFARGIDPDTALNKPAAAPQAVREMWPSRDAVRAFAAEADRIVLDILEREELDRPGHPLLDGAEAAFTILEHEAMHQETLLYIWHRLPLEQKRCPPGYAPRTGGEVPRAEWVDVPAGIATLGVDRGSIPFGWDNEFPAHTTHVAAFAIDRHDVTNAAFLDFVNAGGYTDVRWWQPADRAWIERERVDHPLFWERDDDRWVWRGMFERVPLPLSWPVYVSHAEAAAYARWRGARLPTEAEYQRASIGARAVDGTFDFGGWDPHPAGSRPDGRSTWGVDDLIGNGWEWTSTPFAPFPGFQPMASYPEYSADFFDGEHFVMKGASTATARELLRPTFRNWFRAHYPYVYATFRCVKDIR
jgi:iron(II)-dependent oxidoreductase